MEYNSLMQMVISEIFFLFFQEKRITELKLRKKIVAGPTLPYLIQKNKLYKKELKPRRIKVSKDKIENSYIIFFIMGLKSFASFSLSPLCSTISSIPSHTAYMAHSSIARDSASVEASTMIVKVFDGSFHKRKHIEPTIIKNHILFIVYIYASGS